MRLDNICASCKLKRPNCRHNLVEVTVEVVDRLNNIFQTDYVPSDILLHELICIYQFSLPSEVDAELFIDEFLDGLASWEPIRDVILDSLQLHQILFVHFHENCGVDLSEVHIVEDSLLHIGDVVNSSYSNNKKRSLLFHSWLILHCLDSLS